MVKERDMKIVRATFTPVMPALLVALVGALAWGMTAPASAAGTASSVQTQVSGQVGGGTGGAQLQSSSTETLTGASTERVTFSGNAVVRARVMPDPDFRTPDIVVLFIDMSGVSGVGATSRKKYVTSNKAIVQRRLRPSDSVEVSFPFWQSGTSATGSGPTGKLSLTLTYDVNTKTLTAAAGSITGP
jgi:hypothetical protein